jgi:NAD(P)H-flavin reductase
MIVGDAFKVPAHGKDSGSAYTNSFNQVGFWIHAITGSLYFIFGLMQFSATLRNYAPKFHRAIGYLYYSMVVLTSVGVVLICIGGAEARESSVLWTILALPLWLYWNALSFRAILRRDIQQHRDLNLRAYMLAWSIVMMRPVVLILNAAAGQNAGASLKTSLWFTSALFVLGTEAVLFYERRSRPQARLLPNGKVELAPESIVNAQLVDAPNVWHPAKLESIRPLNERTVEVVLQLDQRGDDDAFEARPLLLGQHIALRTRDETSGAEIVREYTPVGSAQQLENGEVHLVVRLAPEGAMSAVLLQCLNAASAAAGRLLGESNANQVVSMTVDSVVAAIDADAANAGRLPRFDVYFAETRFCYVPNAHRRILMVAAGTGLTPFYNLIRALIENPRDQTRALLVFVNKSAVDTFAEAQLAAWTIESATRGKQAGGDHLAPRFECIHVLTDKQAARFDAVRLLSLVRGVDDFASSLTDCRVLLSGPVSFVTALHEDVPQTFGILREQVDAFGVTDR